MNKSKSMSELREKITSLMVCDSHGYMCEDCPLEENVEKVVTLFTQHAKQIALEAIGEDGICTACRDNTDLSHNSRNFIGTCPVDDDNELRQTQRNNLERIVG